MHSRAASTVAAIRAAASAAAAEHARAEHAALVRVLAQPEPSRLALRHGLADAAAAAVLREVAAGPILAALVALRQVELAMRSARD
jgi:hypothetical protein